MKIKKDDYSYIPGGATYTFTDIEGINFPFQLYIPDEISSEPDLIMGMRTPYEQNDKTFDEMINEDYKGPNPVGRILSSEYHNPCLMPVIPRTTGLQADYLSYYIYNNDFSKAIEASKKGKIKLTEEDINKFKDIHIQVYKMIEEAIKYLRSKDINVDSKIIVNGFSAASKFVIHFSALHPDIVKAIVAGGTGGNHIIPDEDLKLTFPLGVSDIPNFNKEAFKHIKHFYYIGGEDYNDVTTYLPKWDTDSNGELLHDYLGNTIIKRKDGLPAYDVVIEKDKDTGEEKEVLIPKYVAFEDKEYDLDSNGNYKLAYSGYFTKEQVDYITYNLGNNVQDRYDKMVQIYKDNEVDAEFHKYPGKDHSTVFDKELYDDVRSFYNSLHKEKDKTL